MEKIEFGVRKSIKWCGVVCLFMGVENINLSCINLREDDINVMLLVYTILLSFFFLYLSWKLFSFSKREYLIVDNDGIWISQILKTEKYFFKYEDIDNVMDQEKYLEILLTSNARVRILYSILEEKKIEQVKQLIFNR